MGPWLGGGSTSPRTFIRASFSVPQPLLLAAAVPSQKNLDPARDPSTARRQQHHTALLLASAHSRSNMVTMAVWLALLTSSAEVVFEKQKSWRNLIYLNLEINLFYHHKK